ncbi:MAG: toxin-antitoxin system, toxin component, HicA family protein [Lachnospiraceae bacterium]|nr:toxin-antitoxin system, toxin component, HicA family protein [Lachnospiraceae bacterium]
METKDLIRKMKKAGFRFHSHAANHDWYNRGGDWEQIPRHTTMNDKVAKNILKKWGLK